jgi:hypothetical protein
MSPGVVSIPSPLPPNGGISNTATVKSNTLKRPRSDDTSIPIEERMRTLHVTSTPSPTGIYPPPTPSPNIVDLDFEECFATNNSPSVNTYPSPKTPDIVVPSSPKKKVASVSSPPSNQIVPQNKNVAPSPPSPAPTTPSNIRIHPITQYQPPQQTYTYPPQVPTTIERSLSSQPNWVLKVLDKGQPPSQTVYQRILKPCPAVILLPPVQDTSQDFGLFVEASLLRSDSNTELPSTLEGTKIIRIEPGKMASFKKLKILSTTQQIGTLVRIKFQLKKANEGSFITIHGVHTVSNPIEVFSHTYYLKDRASLPTPPVVTEVLPSRGPSNGGTRIAILGDNFIDSPNLRLRFGNTILRPTFHESRTLICTTPPGFPRTVVSVSVSNDGSDYSAVQAQFTYD